MSEKPWRRGGYLEHLPLVKRAPLDRAANPPIEPNPNLLQLVEPDDQEWIRAITMTALLLGITIVLLVVGIIFHARLSPAS